MKRMLSLLLACVLSLGMITPAFAAEDEAVKAAESLYELGLFSGTGVDANGKPIFDLDRAPTRHEAVTMLVAMLGKTEEAKNGTWETPFTDVDDWAKPFVGYAYANGLTSGTSDTTYGGNLPITASQYLTFVLTALGYKSGTDFQWDKAWELSDQIGLTTFRYHAGYTNFTRGDVAVISLSAHELQETIGYAECFGLPADIRFQPKVTDQETCKKNLLYSFLVGNHNLMFAEGTDMYQYVRKNNSLWIELIPLYPELMGAYANTGSRTTEGKTSRGETVSYVAFESTLTTAQIHEQQIAAAKKALEIKETLHESGKIKEGMTQMQIAKAYETYLLNLSVKQGIGRFDLSCAEYDSAYAALINRKADCVGKAAAFNLLMNVEGISVQGVEGSFHGTDSGHVMSRVVLDGEEYFSDWGNRRRLGSYTTYMQQHDFVFDPESLAEARASD